MASPVLVQSAINCPKEIVRPVTQFSPSLWGDQFIHYNFDNDQKMAESISKEIDLLKDYVRSKLASGGSQMNTMDLIDTLERLGISYHFENEIEQILEQLLSMNTNYEDESYDLYTVALHFRVFRQHGHHISCDVFSKFTDANGKFGEAHKNDAKGLLSLYEAAYLRIRGEDLLEDALAFAMANLNSLAPNLDSRLRKQIMHALVQPLHLSNPRIEAINFISNYDDDESLLKFAKLDFNLLQMLHKKELQVLSSWWKESDLMSKLPYARDRVVECYFWAVGVYHEPQYSRARIMFAKIVIMASIVDDTYDSYGISEELDAFTEAIQRWDISEIDHLPKYLRPYYVALLKLYKQFEEELTKEGRSYATTYAIEAEKKLVRSYNAESKWLLKRYLPPFDEYQQHAFVTSAINYLAVTSLLGCETALREDFEWLCENPKLLQAGEVICRTVDDAATYEVEKGRGHIATGIECYMKENGVTKEEAINKFREMATNGWKVMNEEYLKPHSSRSRHVRTKIINLERIIHVTYMNNEDGYTEPEKVLKPHIIALFVDPIKID